MPPVSDVRGWAWPEWLALAFVLLCGLPTLMWPLSLDQAAFSYVGREWAEGGLPYRDAWDIKPPGIFLLYGIGWWFTSDFVLAARLLDLAATLTAAGIIIVLCRRIGWTSAGPYAAAFYGGIYFFEFNFSNTAQVENLSAPFIAGAAVLAARGDRLGPLAVAGALIGFAAAMKTTMLVFLALPLIVLLARRVSLRQHAALLAGFLLVPVLFAAYFWLRGGMGELRELVEAQMSYARSTDGFDAKRFLEVTLGSTEFFPYLSYGTLAVLGGMLLFAPMRRRGIVPAWIILFLLQLVAQNKFLAYHHVSLVPPVALGLGWMVAVFAGRVGSVRVGPLRTAFAASLFASLAFLGLRNIAHFVVPIQRLSGRISEERFDRFFVYNYYSHPWSKAAAKDLASITRPDERVLVYAFDPTILLMAGRRSVTRHFSNAPIYLEGWFPDEMRAKFFRQLAADCREHPPAALVTNFQTQLGFLEPIDTPDVTTITFLDRRYRLVSQHGPLHVYRPEEPAVAQEPNPPID